MGRRYETVTLLTDYGLDDEFVGVLKSVIRDLAPHVTTIDLMHGIRPYDVRAGALALALDLRATKPAALMPTRSAHGSTLRPQFLAQDLAHGGFRQCLDEGDVARHLVRRE